MKKVVLTSLAVLGLAFGAFGQGAVIVDNNNAAGYLDLSTDGSHYDGSFNLEVWYKNGTTADNAINSLNGVNSSQAYGLLTADGFSLATQKLGAGNSSGGIFSGVGEVDIKAPGGSVPAGQAGPGIDRTIASGQATFAIVMWIGGSSFSSATSGGLVSFVNPTSDWTIPPPSTPLAPFTDNFGGNGSPHTDLIMTAVPEPGTFALAGLGAAALLILRRRK